MSAEAKLDISASHNSLVFVGRLTQKLCQKVAINY